MASNQMDQMEPIFNQFDSSIQVGLMGSGTNDPAHQNMTASTMQMGLMLSPGSCAPTPQYVSVSHIQNNQRVSMSNMQFGQLGTQAYDLYPQQILPPSEQPGEMEMNFNNMQNLLTSSKRKAPMEPLPNQYASQKIPVPNKRVAQSEHRPWLMQQMSLPINNAPQMHLIPNTSQSQQLQAPKKAMPLQSLPRKSGSRHLLAPKPHTVQVQSSTKAQTESFEPVRSKLRESLASALELITQNQHKPSKPSNLGKDSHGGAASGQSKEGSQSVGSCLAPADAVDPGSKIPKTDLPAGNESAVENSTDASQETSTNGDPGNSAQHTISDGLRLQSNMLLPDEDVSFSDNIFAKDELLQGNGLSWVMDPVTALGEKKEIQIAKNQKPSNQEVGVVEEQEDQTPQMLAAKIEAELFKLFGGVNKKYKEKGRSLLFNLKDRNNPELRERVVAGEIPPEKLCSMSAEELASKELSEWRMAKAEELAQMVVLPDSDVRRLVKKTHKGEFQVEVDEDNSVSVEVSVGASSLTRNRSDTEGKEASPPTSPDVKGEEKAMEGKSKLENSDISCTLTIPSSEGNDLMQGLMVDDGLKDTEFLPPIVSLDEFMESLNSEPPFANLQADEGKGTPKSDNDNSEPKSVSPDGLPEDPVQTTPEKVDNSRAIDVKSDADTKSNEKNLKFKNSIGSVSKGEQVWEGLLQLNVSALASVIAVFKSGEKASAKEWPALIELKGRVRLDAFDKFLQELPMSRSRAVMIVHFVCKEGSAEGDRASIIEVADSYVLDGRVGFAEPSPGVELYLCPTNERMRQMLSKIIASNDQIGVLDNIDHGLIGVFVLRKATSTVSPNSSSSRHKHSSKKQHSSSRRHQEKDVNMNANLTPRSPMTRATPNPFSKPQAVDEDDDDVPPGFGPGAVRDEDDLPEFNFSSGSTQSVQVTSQIPSRGHGQASFRMHSQTPVDQIRELIHKYGQPQTASPRTWQDNRGMGVPVRPWNDDDDDDIPEWQPEASQPQISHQHVQQTMMTAPAVNQLQAASSARPPHQQPNVTTMYPSVNMMQGQQHTASMNTWRGPQWSR